MKLSLTLHATRFLGLIRKKKSSTTYSECAVHSLEENMEQLPARLRFVITVEFLSGASICVRQLDHDISAGYSVIDSQSSDSQKISC